MSLFSSVWSPYFAGVVIGLLQIPTAGLLGLPGLGTSSSFVTFGSTCCSSVFPSLINGKKYLQDSLTGDRNRWQVAVVIGIISAAIFSRYSNESKYLPRSEATFELGEISSFFVGFVLIFGARLANGCTSGHGITGSSKLNIGSLIATAAMFAGGIATALVF
jgi:hypothetical protein